MSRSRPTRCGESAPRSATISTRPATRGCTTTPTCLSIGARVVGEALADEILATWLATEFEGGRHVRRLEEIAEIENEEASR